jgi:peroxiredoxin
MSPFQRAGGGRLAEKGLMVATICLLGCALGLGQVGERGDWQLLPQMARGQELIYSGSFTEEALSPGVQFQRAFAVDTTVLVLDAADQQFTLAFLTVVSPRNAPNPRDPANNTPPPSSVRLEVLPLSRQGLLKPAQPGALTVPLEGPPTIECSFFREMPRGRVAVNSSWDANEEGRTPWTWRVDGAETVNSVWCVRVVGVQQSADWGTPRADTRAWQRRDTLWISPQLGITHRYERVIERRDAAHQSATHRSVLRCELQSSLTYMAKFFDDKRHEIEQASKFAQEAEPWLRDAEKNKASLETLAKRVKQYCEAEPGQVPYRKAVVQVQKRIEAALRGETVPDPQAELSPVQPARAALGQRMPDFVCSDLLTHQTHRLERLLGKPVLVVFFNPTTPIGLKALRFAQVTAEHHPKDVNLLVLAVTEDEDLVQRQHKEMKLPFPILDGNGVLGLFGVDATPRFVVLDAQGIVRGAWTGWGINTAAEVSENLLKWLAK